MSFTSLLASATGAASATTVKLLPHAQFLAKISSHEVLPRFWRAKGDKPDRAAYCYSASFELVDYFPSGDEDKDDFALSSLATYGDWKGKKLSSNGSGVIETLGPDKRLMVMGIGPGVFGIIDTTPDFSDFVDYSKELVRFVKTDDSGKVVGGFVSFLSKEPTAMVPLDLAPKPADDEAFRGWLEEVMAATDDTYCVLEVGTRKYTREGSTEEQETQELVGIQSVG